MLAEDGITASLPGGVLSSLCLGGCFPLPSSAQWWGWSLPWGWQGLGDIFWDVSGCVVRLSHILLLFQPSPCLLLGPRWPLCAAPAMTGLCRCFLLPQPLSVPFAGEQTLLESVSATGLGPSGSCTGHSLWPRPDPPKCSSAFSSVKASPEIP